jgi:hypothetical protein
MPWTRFCESFFESFQFVVSDVENALLEFDSNKGPGPNEVPPLILKNCASALALRSFVFSSIDRCPRVFSLPDGSCHLLRPFSRR